LNPDGQSSLFVQGNTPSTYTYPGDPPALASPVASLTVTPASLPAGVDGMLQVDVAGASFVAGQTVAGFGSSDILVTNVAVVSPTRLLVNVSIHANASVGSAHLSVVSGLHLISQQFAFQVLPPARSFWLRSNIHNAATGEPGITAGSQAVVTIGNGPSPLLASNLTLLLNDQATPFSGLSNGQVTFQIPPKASPGAFVIRLDVSGERSSPILLVVDPPAPKILSASPDNGDPSGALKAGQLVALMVSDLEAEGMAVDAGRIAVDLAGTSVRVAQVVKASSVHKVLVYVPESSPTGTELPLTLSIDSRTSEPLPISIEN
jgi:hypothetical protein